MYVANAHNSSMAVTAAITPVRIVCANTLGYALPRAEGANAQRTFRFRHTGGLHTGLHEARRYARTSAAVSSRSSRSSARPSARPPARG
jgi:hypothetical protein